MKPLLPYQALGTLLLAASLGAVPLLAQGGGGGGGRNFDPAQMQQRMLDSVQERLGLKEDAPKWMTLQPLVQKVMDLRREVGGSGMMGRMGRGWGNRGGSNTNAAPAAASATTAPSHPEADALQQALDSHAPDAQIAAALEKYRQARKSKEAELATAQETLRKALTPYQEAQAALLGLVK